MAAWASIVRPLVALLLATLSTPGVPAHVADDGPHVTALAVPVSDEAAPLVVDQVELVVTDGEQVAGPTQPGEAAPDAALVDPDDGPIVADEDDSSAGRVETDPVEVSDAQMLGVTWPEDSDVDGLDPQVRTLQGGVWSAWTPLDSDMAPDAGTVDARTMRGGTDSFWIADADAVQLSFAASEDGGPDDMRLALVKSEEGVGATISPAVFTGGSAQVRTVADPNAPVVISRAAWGARPQACTPDVASGLVGAAVHHTAGSNSYSTVAQAMAQIRGDQAYHIDGRGWCDIGYNFIVDKWGNIYEGRANSLTQPVIGVHAGGFNTGTVGVAMLGTYDSTPSEATLTSVGRVIGWRLGTYSVDPAASMSYWTGVGENSRYQNQTVTLPRVFGHRDVAYTACPGNGGYAALPAIRSIAASVAAQMGKDAVTARVSQIYRDMLHRAPDPSGLYTWVSGALLDGNVGGVSAAIAQSVEYVQGQIGREYGTFLGRSADATGLKTWTDEITSGRLRVENLALRLIGSEEFWARSGSTAEGYVSQLYTTILGRPAGAAEIASWADVVRRAGRDAAASGVWRSLESAQRRVVEVYQTFLERSPDAFGIATWPPVWVASGDDALRAGIVDSDEYLNRAYRYAARGV